METKELCRRFLAASQRIAGSWSIEEGLSGLAHTAASLLRARSVAIALADATGGTPRIIASHGLSASFLNHHQMTADEPGPQRVMVGGEDVCLDDVASDDPLAESLRLEATAGALIATPIVAMGRTIGLIVATRDTDEPFDEESMLVLKLAARMAAACHDRCRLYDERRRWMAVDPQTGLWSYEFFCNRMREEIARSRRQGTPLAAALVDIDGFLRYRQTNGTEAADELFLRFVDLVRSAVRGIDFLGRFGLDEILVALPDTDRTGGVKAAERIRQAIEQSDLPKSPQAITASVGVAELHDGETEPGGLVERAKRALYATYLKGGNCVCDERAE